MASMGSRISSHESSVALVEWLSCLFAGDDAYWSHGRLGGDGCVSAPSRPYGSNRRHCRTRRIVGGCILVRGMADVPARPDRLGGGIVLSGFVIKGECDRLSSRCGAGHSFVGWRCKEIDRRLAAISVAWGGWTCLPRIAFFRAGPDRNPRVLSVHAWRLVAG